MSLKTQGSGLQPADGKSLGGDELAKDGFMLEVPLFVVLAVVAGAAAWVQLGQSVWAPMISLGIFVFLELIFLFITGLIQPLIKQLFTYIFLVINVVMFVFAAGLTIWLKLQSIIDMIKAKFKAVDQKVRDHVTNVHKKIDQRTTEVKRRLDCCGIGHEEDAYTKGARQKPRGVDYEQHGVFAGFVKQVDEFGQQY